MQAGPAPGGAWAPPAPVTTGAIPWIANAAAVQDALEGILGAGNVRVTGGPAPAAFNIEFIGALRGTDVNELTIASALTGSTATVSTVRHGQSDNLQSAGDSGGPAFINGRIAGIVSYSRALPPLGQVPDINATSNNSYGEMAVMTRVSSFLPFINGTLAATTNYDLVLDMNQQALGVDRATDDITITARRNGANLQLVVNDPSSPRYSGVYFSGPAAAVRSLTLRGSTNAGSQDNDTFIINGDLRLGPAQNGNVTVVGGGADNTFEIKGNQQIGPSGNGTITVNGRGAHNTLEIDDTASTANNVHYDVSSTRVSGANQGGATRWVVNYAAINTDLEVSGGSGSNGWTVSSTPACPTTINSGTGANFMDVLTTRGPLTINGQSGIDTVDVRNAHSLQGIAGNLDVTNSGGQTSLTLDDSADPTGRNNAVLTAYSLSGLAPALISWTPRDISNLNILGGPGGNTFTVRNTPPGAAAQANINTGTGTDHVYVQATQRRLTINGQRGIETSPLG
jgi:hypothetical protein